MDVAIPSARGRRGGHGGAKSHNKKRKHRSLDIIEEVREHSKSARFDESGGGKEERSPWNNLQLVLSLQDKNVDILKNINLAFDFVKSRNSEEMDNIARRSQVLDASRTTGFLNNWVQSVLISSEKKMRHGEEAHQYETSGSILDLRCWKIFQFCLEESKNLHISLTCSRDFLRVIHSIARDASSCLNNMSTSVEETLSGERLQIYNIVLDCVSMLFSFHGGVANENLDLWILLTDKVLDTALKVVTDQLDGSKLGNFILQLACYLFEPFAKFLSVHPTRKNGFHNFIDKLLEPLLHFLHVLQSKPHDSDGEWKINLPKRVEEVLAQGLFHPTHIDGFLSSQSSVRYRNYSDAAMKDEKLVNKSYHRHLFDKVEKIVAKKNGLALIGLGKLLHLFVSCVMKQNGILVGGGGPMRSDFSSISHVSSTLHQSQAMASNMTPASHSMDAELRKSIFDIYIQIMEYLLADINKYLQLEGKVVSVLYNVSSTLQSINGLLFSLICDRLYLRTEDTSEGASRNFLRSIHALLMSLSAKIETSLFDSDENPDREVLISVRTELIVSVHHLLNIEYEVVGDDLESLWAMIFSSAACCYRLVGLPGQPLLSSEILSLSCRLIDVYSDLRQVDSAIFALCRAARQSSLLAGDSEAYSLAGICSSFSDSLSVLFCSSKFRLSFSNAIKAIPEGQGSACLRQLCSDIKESLEWMKIGDQFAGSGEMGNKNLCCYSLHGDLRAELLGKVLCEAYTIILDSITVTSGNSVSIGASLKSFIEVMRPSLGRLVTIQPDSSIELTVLVDGRILSKSTGPDNMTMCWILVLFLRLIISCRSLFRQAISLMPPDASKKMSGVIGDSLTVHCGRDWLEMIGYAGDGFFSWILQPSVALLDVIHSVSDICIQDSVVLCPPLVYILNAAALQRLADLNRLLKSSEYMLQWNLAMDPAKLKDDIDLSSNRKRIRKWTKCVTKMRKEAAGLTEFMVECLPSVVKNKKSSSLFDDDIDDALIHGLHDNNMLNISVGFLGEKSLTSALWWIICKNVDLWCSHANKKHLKNFLTLIIRESLSCLDNYDCHFQEPGMSTIGCLKTGTAQQIALEFLSNIISYEQRFVRRYMASRFCRILQKSVLSIFNTSEVDLSEPPDWLEAIAAVENITDVKTDNSPWKKRNMVPAESCNKQLNVKFARCQWLLHLLMRMPEEYLSLKSSALYITYILNFERLLVGSMLGWCSATCSLNSYQIFQLLVTCRKVLQLLAVASSKDNVNGSQSPLCLFPLPWLLKSLSVVIGFQDSLPTDVAFEARAAIFSLLDYTSNVLLTVISNQYKCAISDNEESDLSVCILPPYPRETSGACQSILELAKAIEYDLQKSLTTVREASVDKKIESMAGSQELNKLSSITACFQGLLWGLASTLGDERAVNSNSRMNSSSYDVELMTRIKSCVDAYVNFATIFAKALFIEDSPTLYMSAYGDGSRAGSSSGQYGGSTDGPNEGFPTAETVPSDIKSDLTKCKPKRKFCLTFPDLEAFLTEVQHQKLHLKKSLLMQAFRGENAEAALFLRQLFIACSSILRLNLQIEFTSLSWSLFPIVVDISEFMLLEFSISELPDQFTLFWLDGVVRFLEELGNYFPHFDPSLSKDFYVKLIVLHQRAIGKCICLQGKEAKLASQERGSLTKLAGQVQSQFSRERSQLAEFKERLRMSFITYIRKSSEFHLLSVIQAVERALVGVREVLMTNYEIVCGSLNGGEVSSVVAAGIDCLDSIIEFVTGPRRLNMIKKHIQSLVACLFNIILHLQGPSIFYGYVDSSRINDGPDSGSVTLMCIEILTKISGKPSLFEIDACHIAQSLRVPGALFQYFLQHLISESPVKATVDRKVSIELYDACCRMLCTALKHHKSETRQCIALLQDSVSVLLHCLETVNTNHIAGREFFAWEIQEAVICASSLRRVYEEVRQQKDVFGQFSFQFLSRYIWVYCGFGPAKNGIVREVDKALKPGLYALIDSCSDDDLQLLHTAFGEGPCRSTLATLQHDYTVNFQFVGKV
ncbi:hypothetical protein C2S53_014024 [Perilla frutescens var. hirtella]|uniref:Nucleolar 27S pre-rRNA processing Urb2/Npa2 C-terminal domain-containing protein n=1 Tax=Perilla frutescens var. hirtella TaxID=608512 RepID=A0AAD4NZ29_PERFH|nr:hypothetical protein C2S53_014024 [Perilla frutescens var. hirtella]